MVKPPLLIVNLKWTKITSLTKCRRFWRIPFPCSLLLIIKCSSAKIFVSWIASLLSTSHALLSVLSAYKLMSRYPVRIALRLFISGACDPARK